MTALDAITAALELHFGRKGAERARIVLHDLVKAGTPLLDVDAYEQFSKQWLARRPVTPVVAFGDAIKAGQRANLRQLADAAERARDDKHQRDAKRDLFGLRIERPDTGLTTCKECGRWYTAGELHVYVPGDPAVCFACGEKLYEEIPPTPEAT